jgi:Uma2 family endonuclease
MSTVIDAIPEAQLPDHYEVVNGQVVEISPMSAFASEFANRLRDQLAIYAARTNNGRPRMDMLFRLPLAEDGTRNRAPDAAFIKFDRWPENRPMPYRGNPVDVVPNLAVEVVSPTDGAEALLTKAHEYLRAGVELVWVVFPRLRQLYAYTAVDVAPRLFTAADVLDAGDVLPGFSTPMTPLFPIPQDEPEAANDE